jgi:hypothetical protein
MGKQMDKWRLAIRSWFDSLRKRLKRTQEGGMRCCWKLYVLIEHKKNRVTKVTHFELVYGQEVVLQVEVNLQICRIAK